MSLFFNYPCWHLSPLASGWSPLLSMLLMLHTECTSRLDQLADTCLVSVDAKEHWHATMCWHQPHVLKVCCQWLRLCALRSVLLCMWDHGCYVEWQRRGWWWSQCSRTGLASGNCGHTPMEMMREVTRVKLRQRTGPTDGGCRCLRQQGYKWTSYNLGMGGSLGENSKTGASMIL